MSMEKSEKFDLVKGYYAEGKENSLWTKEQVFNAVGKWITAEEYKEITGEEYVAPEKVLTETEQAVMDTAINVEYLVCMKELGL